MSAVDSCGWIRQSQAKNPLLSSMVDHVKFFRTMGIIWRVTPSKHGHVKENHVRRKWSEFHPMYVIMMCDCLHVQVKTPWNAIRKAWGKWNIKTFLQKWKRPNPLVRASLRISKAVLEMPSGKLQLNGASECSCGNERHGTQLFECQWESVKLCVVL